jgi:hypothetical protein
MELEVSRLMEPKDWCKGTQISSEQLGWVTKNWV